MSTEGKRKIFVAMSGGVDSSVAALLLRAKPSEFEKLTGRPAPQGLRDRGYEVTGVFMRCYNLDGCAERDAADARRVASHLGIPFYVWDFEEEYKHRVVDYMIQGYARGITPNPDVMCNKEIKFGLFLEKALALGADYVATGHYVRLLRVPVSRHRVSLRSSDGAHRYVLGTQSASWNQACVPPKVVAKQAPVAGANVESSEKNIFSLYEAKDKNKDQSYFLWTLTQDQLKYCLFPIGEFLKSEVREIARQAGLPTAEKKDSQGICFLGKVTLQDFLKNYILARRGEVLTIAGRKVGEHEGAEFYTIGERHIGVGGLTKPHYVAAKDLATNTVVVAEGSENPALYRREVELANANFISPQHSNILKNVGMSVMTRVRYRQPLARAMLHRSPSTNSGFRLVFDNPQKFVASGQSAVFYSVEGEMLGGGVIL